MSRPRYLADNDLNDAIVVGILRRDPAAGAEHVELIKTAADV